MATLGIGVIGAGMIGKQHLANFVGDRRTRVLWVADIDPAALDYAASHFGPKHLTNDYRELLADPAVDAVVVATPPSEHTRQAIDSLRAGKHVMLEKPMAPTLSEARRVLAEANRRPDLLITDCSCRHARLNPKFAKVKQIIESGVLGDVYFIHHNSVNRQGRGGLEYNPPAKWFLDRAIAGGGPMYDWGVYDLSFHLGVLGEPRFLRAAGGFCVNGLDRVDPGTPVFTVEEHGGALMEFEGGLKYYWERATNAHSLVGNETRIYGTKGGLRFGFCTWDSPQIVHYYVDRAGRGKARQRTLRVNLRNRQPDMHYMGRAFVDAVLAGGPPPMPLDLAYKNLQILHKVYRAAGW